MNDTELLDFMTDNQVTAVPIGSGENQWTIGGKNLNLIREFRGDERVGPVANPKFLATARACIADFAEWYRRRV